MKLIVVTDIFGETSALRELVSSISAPYKTSIIISPYDDSDIQFVNEEEAYQAFQTHCGLARLYEKLKGKIAQQSEAIDIIGFSVGGTCAWCISGERSFGNIRQIISFYGSRIRHHLDVTPEFPTIAIFPRHEAGFDIEPVMQTLKAKPKTEVVKTAYLHGFMNRQSIHFSETGYREFIEWLVEKAIMPNSSSGPRQTCAPHASRSVIK